MRMGLSIANSSHVIGFPDCKPNLFRNSNACFDQTAPCCVVDPRETLSRENLQKSKQIYLLDLLNCSTLAGARRVLSVRLRIIIIHISIPKCKHLRLCFYILVSSDITVTKHVGILIFIPTCILKIVQKICIFCHQCLA